jgi:NADH-quinone oxidoreductase subunit J
LREEGCSKKEGIAVEAVIYVCLLTLFIFGVMAVMLRSMIKSAIALAAASAVLGMIMYELGGIWAALFEVSVCSGLVTVIFVSAISLSNMDKKELGKVFEDKKRMALLPYILIVGGVVLIAAALLVGDSLPAANQAVKSADDLREILWNNRQADIWGQIIVLLAGAVAVVVLFRERD